MRKKQTVEMGKMNFIYHSTLKSVRENPIEASQVAIDEIAEIKGKVEVELHVLHYP